MAQKKDCSAIKETKYVKKMKKDKNLYVIRKYVLASTAEEAIKKEKFKSVDEVWLHEGFQQEKIRLGFNVSNT